MARVAALLCSILLVAGYVAYQAGWTRAAEAKLRGADTRQSDKPSSAPASAPSSQPDDADLRLLPGPKSAPVFERDQVDLRVTPPAPVETAPDSVFETPPDRGPATQAAKARRHFFPGSKSGVHISEAPVVYDDNGPTTQQSKGK